MHHDNNFTEPVFYVPGHLEAGRAPVILDAAIRDGGGEYRGTYMLQSLSDVRKTYPDARIGDLETVMEEKRQFYRRVFSEITEDEFRHALGLMPPVDWQRTESAESFKMSERLFANITAIYCRLGARYFRFNDGVTMSHAHIVDHVQRKIAA